MQNKGTTTILFLSFILFLTAIMLIFNQNSIYTHLILVPMIYGLLFIACAKIHHYYSYPGMFVLNCISFVRYVIIPLFIILDSNYYDKSGGMLSEGIVLMLYEEICLGIFLTFLTKKHYEKFSIIMENKNFETAINTKIGYVFKAIIVIGLMIVATNPQSLNQFNFVTTSSNLGIYKYGEVISGASSIILGWSKLVLPLLLVSFFLKKYRQRPSRKYYFVIVFIVLFFNLMIFTGISRNSAILPGTASMFFIIKIFPYKKKQTFALISVVIILVVITLTAFKNSYLGVNDVYTFSSLTGYLESYFAGPRQLGYALKAKEILGDYFNIKVFLNDIFANVPGISKFFNLENRTTTFFNIAVYNWGAARDAIIPTIGQGLFYFGYIFAAVPELLLVWIMAKLDKLYLQANNIMNAFFIAYFAVRFGNNFAQNLTILSGFLFSTVLPIATLLYINKKVKVK